MRLSKLMAAVKDGRAHYKNEEWEREIATLSVDSREKMENGLFFCLKGENADGGLFAEQSVKNGAVAVVAEEELGISVPQIVVKDVREALGLMSSAFYGEPSARMKVVGITGTNGKTTTSYMLASILQKAGKNVGVIGTLGISYNGQTYPSDLTTPDPVELQRTLAKMSLHGVEYVVMEVSAHALHYRKIAGISFSACIFTNLSQDHLDFFTTMTAYKNVKKQLFSNELCPIAVVNGDEETGREIAKEREGKHTQFYGLNTPADAFAVVTDEGLNGTKCLLNVDDKLFRISLSMAGRHNVYNALAAASCALALGVSPFAIEAGLNEIKSVNGRLEWVAKWQDAHIFVDFAHTPDGLEKSLEALRPHCKGRLICLFGCGGNRDKTKRPIMGEIAAKKADFCILTSDNPRYEDPLDVIVGIEKGYRKFSACYVVVPDRKKALEYALDVLQKGDVLLVAGKGGETTQEIMGIKYPFNDHDNIKELMARKGKNPL